MKQQRLLLPGKRQSSGVMRPTFDDLEKPFYDRGIVEMVDFLWEYEKYSELKRWNDNVKHNRIVLWRTYKEAKDLELIVKAKIDNEIIQANKKESCDNKLDDVGNKIGQTNIRKKNIPEVEIGNTFVCYQQSAEMESVIAMNDLDRCYRNESGVKNDNILDGNYNATYDVINVYSGNDENQGYEINEKCRNKSDDVEYSDDMIIETAEVDQLLSAMRNDRDYESGFEKDDREAFINYQTSKEMGYDNGKGNLGYCYQDGIAVEKEENNMSIDFKNQQR
ncbi:hypothetical protein C2G38_2166993 [Gigaspora rosea]|uniref:Uncharacterized protein n=1 Tax=Gigaspora rosea TaxID=44941 RepID=A0A397W131_9GLOM|nr:hypothetical protein C2G38_2166993 [Gigaspora rosea]